MNLVLNEREAKRVEKVLLDAYKSSLNLFEICEIKEILKKMGVEVQDWTPTMKELEE